MNELVRQDLLDKQKARKRKQRQKEKQELFKQKQREANRAKRLKDIQKTKQDIQERRKLEEKVEVKEKIVDFSCPHCFNTIPNLRKISMEERKAKIVKTYGLKPTICYYYYLWNAIDYVGEEKVRRSFDSIKGQGDEIIAVDYSSTDGTRELCEEYGFKVVNVETEEDSSFRKLYPTSKMTNAVIHESKSNFLLNLNVHTKYRPNMDAYCKGYIRDNDITKVMRIFRGKFLRNGFVEDYGAACIIYKPFLIAARGYDERTYYAFGTENYFISIMLVIYDLEEDNFEIGIIHNDTKNIKMAKLYEMFNDNTDIKDLDAEKIKLNKFRLERENAFKEDFDEAVKDVVNSYW